MPKSESGPNKNPGSEFNLFEDIFYLMSHVVHLYFEGMRDEFLEFDVSRSEWRCLAALKQNSPSNVGTLVDVTHQSQSTVSRTVAKLQSQGWVKRTSPATDARYSEIALTNQGRKKLEELMPALNREYQRAVSSFSKEQVDILRTHLRMMLVNLAPTSGGKASEPLSTPERIELEMLRKKVRELES